MKKKMMVLGALCCSLVMTGCTPPDVVSRALGKAESTLEQAGLLDAPAAPDYSMVAGYDELDAERYETPPASGYYVVHDGMYYPMCYPDWCDDADFAENMYGTTDSEQMVVTDVRIALENQYDPCIPTLYLANGDTLVYCADDYLLEFYYFTKFEDLGYSVPITQFEQTVAGYPYVYLDKKTETGKDGGVLMDADTKKLLLNQPVLAADDADATLCIYSVNDTPFTMDYIRDGLIYGLTRDATYQFNGAFGTQDFQWTLPASYHFFKQSELYGEAAYESGYDGKFVLQVPDYLTDGYYMLSDGGMFRLLRDTDSYNMYDTESFNAKALGFDTQYALDNGGTEDDNGSVFFADGTPAVNDKHMYSSNEALCTYKTKVPDALGYEPEEGGKGKGEGDADQTESMTKQPQIEQTSVAYYKLVPKRSDGKEKEVSVGAGQVLCTFSSSATDDRAPCMIQYALPAAAAQTLPVSKNDTGDAYIYNLAPEGKSTVSEDVPVYFAIYYQNDSGLAVTAIADGLDVKPVTDLDEVPKTLLEK